MFSFIRKFACEDHDFDCVRKTGFQPLRKFDPNDQMILASNPNMNLATRESNTIGNFEGEHKDSYRDNR